MDDFINKFSSCIGTVALNRRHKNIIGVIIRFSFMCRSEQRALLVSASQWAINPRDNLSETNVKFIEERSVKS